MSDIYFADKKPMILIIDNTAFAMGFNINILQDQWEKLQMYTTSRVFEESERNPKSQQFLEIALYQKLIRIEDANQKALENVKKCAKETGDLQSLSEPDCSLIALAYEMQQHHPKAIVGVLSDDYAVQNVCAVLEIQTYALFKTGIQKIIYWEVYCPQCFLQYPKAKLTDECPKCDCKLKRRPRRQQKS